MSSAFKFWSRLHTSCSFLYSEGWANFVAEAGVRILVMASQAAPGSSQLDPADLYGESDVTTIKQAIPTADGPACCSG